MSEFVKGDVAVWNETHNSNRMTKGKGYSVLSASGGYLRVVMDNGEEDGWYYTNFAPRQVGPVRTETVTKRRIVPGVYGRIRIWADSPAGMVRWSITGQSGVNCHDMTATELDDLAMVASQLAEALRDD